MRKLYVIACSWVADGRKKYISSVSFRFNVFEQTDNIKKAEVMSKAIAEVVKDELAQRYKGRFDFEVQEYANVKIVGRQTE